ncbi:MAG: VOC family protein [Gemmatimonadota bacterium]|nr:VOC family protein [Gemmatimonadota bacterium]MDH3423858.1 VOC family protein [Gemmatimonadota bacterium]
MSNDSQTRTERAKPETLRLASISTALTVDDIHESLKWYTDVVGFTVKDRWENEGELHGAELVAGDTHLMIGQDDWGRGRDRKKGEGFRLYFMTAQDVDELAAAIKERGGALETEPQEMPWGGRAFTLIDPSGFKITVSDRG